MRGESDLFTSPAGRGCRYVGGVGADGTGPTDVYLADGSNPINSEEWATYTPPSGYIKNTTRNARFDSI